jgi:chromosome segregation ATPase
MISGYDALQSIEEAYATVRNDEMRLDSALRSASEQAARLRQERLSQLHALAQLKFGLIERGELIHELDAAEQQAQALLDRIRREVDEADRRRREAAGALKAAEEARSARARDLEEAVAELRAFEERATPAIVADPKWSALNARIEALGQILEEAEKKAGQAETDRQQKKTPYEQDRLFMYLWRRKFGSSEYGSGPFVRYFDEMIARLIRFQQARANYALLNQIPDRLREHAGRVRAQFEDGRTELAALRQAKLIEAGAGPAQERATQAKAALDACEAELAAAKQAFDGYDSAYHALVGRDNRGAYAEAIRLMAENDSRDAIVTLYREAARTATDADRAFVEKIDALTKAIGAADVEVMKLRSRIEEVAARRVEIEAAHADFRRRRYDYPGTTFGNGATINDVLGGVLDGLVKGAVLGEVLQQGYRRPPSPGWDGGWIDIGPMGGPLDRGPMGPMDGGPGFPQGLPGDSSSGPDFDTGGSF